MNTKMKLLLLGGQLKEKGFSSVYAMGIGLVGLAVGMTLMARDHKGQVVAYTQQEFNQVSSIADVGVTRIQSVLLRVPGLAKQEYNGDNGTDEWTAYATELDAGGGVCGVTITDILNTVIQQPFNDAGGAGKFRLVSYTPPGAGGGEGTLKIQATTDTTVASVSDFNKTNSGKSTIEVKIPLNDGTGTTPPGLWVATFDDGSNKSLGETNQQINADVVTQDCNTDDFNSTKNFPSGTNWRVSAQPMIKFPDLPELPSNITALSDLSSCSALTTSSTPNQNILAQVADQFKGVFISPAMAANDKGKGKDSSSGSSGSKGSSKKTISLPGVCATAAYNDQGTPSDTSDDTYDFLVSELSSDDITVDLTGLTGKAVRIFVQGNIELKGNAGISSEPNTLQIYGSNGAGINGKAVNYALPGDSNQYTTTEVLTRGGANIYSFLFAPAATAGVKGGGNGGGFYGVMWVNNWAGPGFGSSSNKIVIDPPSNFNWDLLPENMIDSITVLPGNGIQPLTARYRKES